MILHIGAFAKFSRLLGRDLHLEFGDGSRVMRALDCLCLNRKGHKFSLGLETTFSDGDEWPYFRRLRAKDSLIIFLKNKIRNKIHNRRRLRSPGAVVPVAMYPNALLSR